MASVQAVADYFIHLSTADSEDAGETISNLKLQKLLYYAQGFHLAIFRVPMFPDHVEAWIHGPVVPAVYHKFKKFGPESLPKPEHASWRALPQRIRRLLDDVYKVYGQFSAWKLRTLTHSEPPWKDTPQGGVISRAAMRRYFETQLVNG